MSDQDGHSHTSSLKKRNIDQITSDLSSGLENKKRKTEKRFVCKQCSYEFDKLALLKQHLAKSHRPVRAINNTKCVYCDKNFSRAWTLRRHLKKMHSKTGAWQRKLNAKNQKQKPKQRNLNYTQIDSLLTDPPLCPGAKQLMELEYPEDSLPEVAEYWDMIRNKHREGKLLRQYNKRLTSDYLNAEGEIREFVMQIHQRQTTQYKLQIGWGCLLHSDELQAYRYFWADNMGKRFFPAPVMISKQEDIEIQCQKITSSDWIEHVTLSRAVATLDKNTKGKPYADDCCFFRCLAFVQSGSEQLQTKTKKLKEQYRTYANLPETYDGSISLDDCLLLEQCFQIRINVYQLLPPEEQSDLTKLDWKDLTAEIVRSSPRTKKESPNGTLNLDICSDHLSVIRKLSGYCRVWNCTLCNQPFHDRCNCKRHEQICAKNSGSRGRYSGGTYQLPKNVWDRATELGFDVAESFRYCEYHSSFDFECISPELSEDDPRQGGEMNKLRFERRLELLSCSVHGNYPSCKTPVHFRRHTTELELVQRLLDYMSKISEEHENLMRAKLDSLYDQIHHSITDYNARMEENNNGNTALQGHCKYMVQQLERLVNDLDEYTRSPVFYAFNGSRFDFKVAKRYLVPEVICRDMQIKGIIKRQDGYQMFKTDSFVMKDAASLMPQGTSLRAFLESQNVTTSKSHWPHDWCTSMEKLDDTELPPLSAFADGLTGGKISITEQEYKELQQEFDQLPQRNMWGMLGYYNDRDVLGMVETIERLRQFWKGYNICIIQDCLSLSGLSALLLQKNVKKRNFLWLPDKNNAFVWDLVKKAVVGGPSIVWNRYHERDQTRIRNDQNGELCKSVIGLDQCQLYLSCIEGEMPTGIPVHWKFNEKTEKFHRKALTPAGSSLGEIEFVMWRAFQLGVEDRMRHRFCYGQTKLSSKIESKQKYFNFRPDGLLMKEKKVFNYHGCAFHLHDKCSSGKNAIERTAVRDVAYRNELDKKASEFYAAIGFEEEIVFECEWKSLRRQPEVKSFLNDVFTLPLTSTGSLTQEQMLRYIQNETLYGLCRVDIEVPDCLYDKFSEMSPIFTNLTLDRRDLSSQSLEYAEKHGIMTRGRRSLVGVMKAKNICLISNLVSWYTKQGLKVTKLYEVVQFKPKCIYKDFVHMISSKRAQALVDPSKKTEAAMMKLAGNAAYDKFS